jgi:hypothetical protein
MVELQVDLGHIHADAEQVCGDFIDTGIHGDSSFSAGLARKCHQPGGRYGEMANRAFTP